MELTNWIGGIILLLLLNQYVYDRYVQRKHQLLINYPVIGRMRYLFELLREPFRQYFADERFYDSREKVDWVYKAAKNLPNYLSFSPSETTKSKFMFKHSNAPLNDDEIAGDFGVLFGPERPFPFRSRSVLGRSAMSDGSISPEGTRAFAKGAQRGGFPINTGEGGLTSNFFITHRDYDSSYMQIIVGSRFQRMLFPVARFFFNGSTAARFYRWMVLDKGVRDTYIFDEETLRFHRPDWNAPLEAFPSAVPADMPDIIFQMGSGLYGVRDGAGNFDEARFAKVMRFCRMCEIKLAQGAKQTGGKLLGSKVTEAVAYFRGIKPFESVFSPNRFPYASTPAELLDFVAKLQRISGKPVGFKMVVSSRDNVTEIAREIRGRIDAGEEGIPDFITVDSGEGGSATAPLELMERVGLGMPDAIYLAEEVLREFGIRDRLKLIASGKVLTPDDAAVLLSLGADYVGIARGFMMSAGCIRARHCSGDRMACPVGLATQDPSRRASYLVHINAERVASYHANMLKGLRTILAVLRLSSVSQLTKDHLFYLDGDQQVYFDVDDYFAKKIGTSIAQN